MLRFANDHQRDFLFVVVAFAICTGVIHFLKSHTSVYCPIETTLYGGKIAHMEWYNNFQLFREAGDGRCWPGMHRAGSLCLRCTSSRAVIAESIWKALMYAARCRSVLPSRRRGAVHSAPHVPHVLGGDLRVAGVFADSVGVLWASAA